MKLYMHKCTDRTWAIDKIRRSIAESRNTEQIISTEQFLRLYYKLFPFAPQHFRDEYLLDVSLQRRKNFLVSVDDTTSNDVVFDAEPPSIRRLNEYVKHLSVSELEAEWKTLEPQLEGVNLKSCPELYEKRLRVSLLEHLQRKKKTSLSLMNW